MPWKKYTEEKARWKFVQEAMTRKMSFAALCEKHEISRECGHKWWRRFRGGGVAALREQSRRPRRVRRQREIWYKRLLVVRRQHPTWGPQKLRWQLQRSYRGPQLPSYRTLSRWLVEAGLARRHQRRSPSGPTVRRTRQPAVRRPNDLWTVDFKGTFRTGNRTRMFPLTVRDAFACCALLVRHLPHPNERAVRRTLTALFRKVGLPRALQVDNGTPFGGGSARGLTALSVWWLRLGLQVYFTRPACPQDNGAHEQMHRVLKAETARPPAAHARAQQRRFDRWRHCYNDERPHARLALRTPGSCYRVSARKLPVTLPEWSYPRGWLRLRPGTNGRAWWADRQRLFGRAFCGEWLGLRPRRNGWTEVYLGPYLLGTMHPTDRCGLRPVCLRPPKRRKREGAVAPSLYPPHS